MWSFLVWGVMAIHAFAVVVADDPILVHFGVGASVAMAAIAWLYARSGYRALYTITWLQLAIVAWHLATRDLDLGIDLGRGPMIVALAFDMVAVFTRTTLIPVRVVRTIAPRVLAIVLVAYSATIIAQQWFDIEVSSWFVVERGSELAGLAALSIIVATLDEPSLLAPLAAVTVGFALTATFTFERLIVGELVSSVATLWILGAAARRAHGFHGAIVYTLIVVDAMLLLLTPLAMRGNGIEVWMYSTLLGKCLLAALAWTYDKAARSSFPDEPLPAARIV